MKTATILKISLLTISGAASFIASYFYDITMTNYEQFLAVMCVVLLDGLFGVIAGAKREGFQTFKAIKVLRTLGVWWLILGCILAVEKGFTGTAWLSETILVPFLVFQIMSALKNASMAGYIKSDLLNTLLDRIDRHKGERLK